MTIIIMTIIYYLCCVLQLHLVYEHDKGPKTLYRYITIKGIGVSLKRFVFKDFLLLT